MSWICDTGPVIALAKLDRLAPLLAALRDRGYWLSDALVAEVRRRAGEA